MNSLNLYHIFYTVAQCGNISAAARKLYISQPAVSKSVSRLEESFSSPLLVRSSRGVTLTENGRLLYKQLETAFQAIRQGEEMISRNDLLGAGSLSMGVSATLCKYVLLPYLQDYIAENPYVKISLSCQSTHETITALENGALELGLVGESERLEGSRLNFLPIREIHDIFVCSPDYLSKLHTRPKEDFQQEILTQGTFLLLNKDNVTRQYIDRHMLLQGISVEHKIEVSTMDLLIDFARIGLGIACVIGEFVRDELQKGSLMECSIREPIPPRRIGFAYPRSARPSAAMSAFLARLASGSFPEI
ncbi:HTH-type transcriptional regulator CynR [Lachnospiraceae bacterium]|nr:LysR family transcriptional regulator [Acetatifactor sp.]GFH94873.1 HTH-type transcriptional regulator CynR [Lachnospiraceae bacterium]